MMQPMLPSILACTECRCEYSPDEPAWLCPVCGSLLELRLDLSSATGDDRARLRDPSTSRGGVWSYAGLIPLDASTAVSLGEGGTPVVHLRALGRALGLPNLYAKLEYFSPTGSFKDRGTTTLVTKARQLGVRRLVEDSSGNAGASIAAYCSLAGIQASIYVPASAPAAKKAQIAFYGAEVVSVGGTRYDVAEAALERCRQDGAYYGSHNANPFFLDGTKTFAFETAAQFDFDPPEHVVVPAGNGSLLLGAWTGFQQMRELGVLTRLPRLHIAQAKACMPIVHALARGLDRPELIPTSPTVAGGISIGRPSRGHLILRAVRESGGSGAASTDEEILSHQRLLARLQGIFCEPTSAAAFAALPELLRTGAISPESRVLVAVTGSGLKDPSVFPLAPASTPM